MKFARGLEAVLVMIDSLPCVQVIMRAHFKAKKGCLYDPPFLLSV